MHFCQRICQQDQWKLIEKIMSMLSIAKLWLRVSRQDCLEREQARFKLRTDANAASQLLEVQIATANHSQNLFEKIWDYLVHK
jgi:hypothetical protein